MNIASNVSNSVLKIPTSRFGEIRSNINDVIHFPCGMIGFPELKEFVVIHNASNPFRWLQSTLYPGVAFAVVDPTVFLDEYAIKVNETDLDLLDIEDPDKSTIYVIVNVTRDCKKMTANLEAPLILNLNKKVGRQVILHDQEEYGSRHSIMGEANQYKLASTC